MSPWSRNLVTWTVKAIVIGTIVLAVVWMTCTTPSGGDIARHALSALAGLGIGKFSLPKGAD